MHEQQGAACFETITMFMLGLFDVFDRCSLIFLGLWPFYYWKVKQNDGFSTDT